ncbi:MAG TPA: hypothetical protein EYQ25_05735 [Planctomycetes bacterium]|nr:hypothetical protein [Planctomycetota bacterium]
MIRLGAALGGLGSSLLGLGHRHATPLVGWPESGPSRVVLADRAQGVLVMLDRSLIPKRIWLVPPPTHLALVEQGLAWVVRSNGREEEGSATLMHVAISSRDVSESWSLSEAPLDLCADEAGRGWVLGGEAGKYSLGCFEPGRSEPKVHAVPANAGACWLRGKRLLFLRGEDLCWVELAKLGNGGPILEEGFISVGGMQIFDLAVHRDGLLLLGDDLRTEGRIRRVVKRRNWGDEPLSVQQVGDKAERVLLRGAGAQLLTASEAWVVHARSRQIELLPVPGERGHLIATGGSGGIMALGDLEGRLLLATPTCLRLFDRAGRLLASQGGFDQLVALGVL